MDMIPNTMRNIHAIVSCGHFMPMVPTLALYGADGVIKGTIALVRA